ncbi:hypothetical protein [Microbacterium marmarense]|uniref:Uncharacterized protein n=1 Tax=Microbacterium marmarense TaxID=3122051 RepID=A0ABU8LRB0_9MICO
MGRRPIPVARPLASGLLLALVCVSAVGCGTSRAYTQAVEEAELGVALLLSITETDTANLLADHTALGEISSDDIATVFFNDMREYTGEEPGPAEERAVYDIIENPDGSVSFLVFFGAGAFASSGLVTTNQSRHSCGSLAGRFAERELTVTDVDCPPEITRFAGDSSIALSMTENATKYAAEIEKML